MKKRKSSCLSIYAGNNKLSGAMDLYTAFFSFIGLLAFANWVYNSFSSLFWITYYNVLELLQPEKYSLEKRFGQWAGEWRFETLPISKAVHNWFVLLRQCQQSQSNAVPSTTVYSKHAFFLAYFPE